MQLKAKKTEFSHTFTEQQKCLYFKHNFINLGD